MINNVFCNIFNRIILYFCKHGYLLLLIILLNLNIYTDLFTALNVTIKNNQVDVSTYLLIVISRLKYLNTIDIKKLNICIQMIFYNTHFMSELQKFYQNRCAQVEQQFKILIKNTLKKLIEYNTCDDVNVKSKNIKTSIFVKNTHIVNQIVP
jgi:hypothetical protein